MAESFYTAGTPSSPITAYNPQSSASPVAPPPPPKPSSHDPSRSSTPQTHTPSIVPAYQTQTPVPTFSQAAPTSPQPPPVPPSPSHAQALAKQQQQQLQQLQSQNQHYQHQHDSQTNTNRGNSGGAYHSAQLNQSQPSNRSANSQQGHQHPSQQQTLSPPLLESGWLPEGLSNKSTADLQPLLNNPEILVALAHQHPSYRSSLEPLQAAIAANLGLAQQVTALEAQVRQLREQTGQLLINHNSLQTQWRRKQGEMEDALSPWGPRAMYQRLVGSIAEQEAILRAVHESFLEGAGDNGEFHGTGSSRATEKEVTEWIRRIREGTTVLEKRREMRARWDEGRVGGWR